MKKIAFVLVVGVIFLFGCGTATQRADFKAHESHYKNWDHLKFSWAGFRKPTKEHAKKSALEGWWGEPINFEGLGD